MLITASWVEKIQKTLGLEAVSQVRSERPAWYFWISDAAGVYHLEVQSTETRNVNGYTLHTAILSLKCYPFAQLKMFPSEECESSPLTPLDSRWWSLAGANYKSEKASTCGCD